MDDHIGGDLSGSSSSPAIRCFGRARAALTLRLIGGLTTHGIARAFLVPEPTVAQRIVRAKRTLAERRSRSTSPARRAGRPVGGGPGNHLPHFQRRLLGDLGRTDRAGGEALRLGRLLWAARRAQVEACTGWSRRTPRCPGFVPHRGGRRAGLAHRPGPAALGPAAIRRALGGPGPGRRRRRARTQAAGRRSPPAQPNRGTMGSVSRRCTRCSRRPTPFPVIELNRAKLLSAWPMARKVEKC